MTFIPFEVLSLIVGISFALPVLGYLYRTAFPMSMMFFLVGAMWLIVFLTTDSIAIAYFPTTSTTNQTIHYPLNGFGDLTTQLTNTTFAVTELAPAPNSALVGDKIQCMDVVLRRSGTPSTATNVISGVFDSSGATVFQFGSILPTSVTSIFNIYTFCVPEGQEVILNSGDRIGIKYQSGNLVDRIEVRSDSSNPFDSTLSFRSTFSGASFATATWTGATTTDFIMKLYDINDVSTEQVNYDLRNTTTLEPTFIGLVFIIFSLSFMIIGILIESKWT